MPRHRLLPEAELQRLLGIPADRDALARRFTLTLSDQNLVLTRRGAANRLGFAVQLALLRHSGRALAQIEEPLDALVAWTTNRPAASGWRSSPKGSRPRGSVRPSPGSAATTPRAICLPGRCPLPMPKRCCTPPADLVFLEGRARDFGAGLSGTANGDFHGNATGREVSGELESRQEIRDARRPLHRRGWRG